MLLTGAVVALGVEAWRTVTPTETLAGGPRVVDIPARAGVLAIARRLGDGGVVRSPAAFVALGVLRGSARALRAGEYEFPRGTTTFGALRLLESGKVRLHPVLHPEGATVAELARALEQQQLGRAEDVGRVAADPVFLRSLGIPATRDGRGAPRGAVTISDLAELKAVAGLRPPGMAAFIAQWSLGETPAELRRRVLAEMAGFDAFLFGYTERFETIDNVGFFKEWRAGLREYRWWDLPLPHLHKAEWYLFGVREPRA